MFLHQGIWLPDGEKHFPEWMDKNGELVDGRGTYQIKKWRACLPWIKNWRGAIDVGGHVGFWSIQMAARFRYVAAYEPMPEFRQCFMKNVLPGEWEIENDRASVDGHRVDLIPYAVGSKAAAVAMNYRREDSGNTHVGGEGEIQMVRLDDEFYTGDREPGIDFIKIDCEGYEHHVIEGALDTILRCKPCIIVEQKQHKMAQNYPGLTGTPAVDMLREMGAEVRREIGGDWILSWT